MATQWNATKPTLGDADNALVACIVRECQKPGGASLGRMALQRVCSFAQALGVPLSRRFRIYYDGPYSETLAAAVDLMVAKQSRGCAVATNPGDLKPTQ